MTDDIVERLRGYKEQHPVADDLREAADEIEQLREVLRIIWVAYQDNDGIRKIFLEAGLRHD